MSDNADLVEITLTANSFESELLAGAVEAEGFQVHLMQHDINNELGGAGAVPSKLLVHAADVDAILEIIGRSHEL